MRSGTRSHQLRSLTTFGTAATRAPERFIFPWVFEPAGNAEWLNEIPRTAPKRSMARVCVQSAQNFHESRRAHE
jgi:hypothetical protein